MQSYHILKCNCIFLDSRILEEYKILKEELQAASVGNMSRASIKFVFRRRIEYHITKTFLQVNAKGAVCNFYV